MHVPERKWTIHTAVPGVTEPFDAKVTGPTVWPSDEPVEVVEADPSTTEGAVSADPIRAKTVEDGQTLDEQTEAAARRVRRQQRGAVSADPIGHPDDAPTEAEFAEARRKLDETTMPEDRASDPAAWDRAAYRRQVARALRVEARVEQLEASDEANAILAAGHKGASEQWEGEAKRLRARVEQLEAALDTLYFELDAGTRDSARYAFRNLHADIAQELEAKRDAR